jgi:hypothetical protein
MKIVQGDELAFERGLEHRGGTFHYIRLMEGEPGTLGNFQLSLGRIGGDFFSPRHRHNFDQFRYQTEGTLDFARDGKLEAGMVGYFPEGVAYGPQTQSAGADVSTIVLQFGGASGGGYLSADEMKVGAAALRHEGEFKDGVFRRRADVEGKRNVDGYQAIWEHVNDRPMVYPQPRVAAPVLMRPDRHDWVPLEASRGVSEKLLGVFTERRSGAGFLRLAPGGRYDALGEAVFLVLSGSGVAGEHPLRRLTTLHIGRGERLGIEADAPMEVLHFTLPNLAALAARADQFVAQAAE